MSGCGSRPGSSAGSPTAQRARGGARPRRPPRRTRRSWSRCTSTAQRRAQHVRPAGRPAVPHAGRRLGIAPETTLPLPDTTSFGCTPRSERLKAPVRPGKVAVLPSVDFADAGPVATSTPPPTGAAASWAIRSRPPAGWAAPWTRSARSTTRSRASAVWTPTRCCRPPRRDGDGVRPEQLQLLHRGRLEQRGLRARHPRRSPGRTVVPGALAAARRTYSERRSGCGTSSMPLSVDDDHPLPPVPKPRIRTPTSARASGQPGRTLGAGFGGTRIRRALRRRLRHPRRAARRPRRPPHRPGLGLAQRLAGRPRGPRPAQPRDYPRLERVRPPPAGQRHPGHRPRRRRPGDGRRLLRQRRHPQRVPRTREASTRTTTFWSPPSSAPSTPPCWSLARRRGGPRAPQDRRRPTAPGALAGGPPDRLL